jgi:hypothetical protein
MYTKQIKEHVIAREDSRRACSFQEVEEFCSSLELPNNDANWFWHKCQENGWKNAGRPIRDWKLTIRAWKAGGYMPSQKNGKNNHSPPLTDREKDQLKTGLVYDPSGMKFL